MIGGPATLDPTCAGDDAFLDALLGLHQVCGWLAPEPDGALPGGGSRETSPETASPDEQLEAIDEPSDEPEEPPDVRPEPPEEPPEELIDEPLAALLGLVSVQTTISLVLAALRSEHAAIDPDAAGATRSAPSTRSAWSMWSREQLR